MCLGDGAFDFPNVLDGTYPSRDHAADADRVAA